MSSDLVVDYSWEINKIYNYIFYNKNLYINNIGLFYLDFKNERLEELSYFNKKIENYSDDKIKNYELLIFKKKKINKKILINEYSYCGLHLGSFIHFLKFQRYDYLDQYKMDKALNKSNTELVNPNSLYDFDISSEFLDIRNSN
jgi:hypothetical protein